MKVTKLANAKGSLPELAESLEGEIVANRNGGTDRFVAELSIPSHLMDAESAGSTIAGDRLLARNALVILGQYDYAKRISGKPGEPLLRLAVEDT